MSVIYNWAADNYAPNFDTALLVPIFIKLKANFIAVQYNLVTYDQHLRYLVWHKL